MRSLLRLLAEHKELKPGYLLSCSVRITPKGKVSFFFSWLLKKKVKRISKGVQYNEDKTIMKLEI